MWNAPIELFSLQRGKIYANHLKVEKNHVFFYNKSY
jgi:hypothetical protein